MYNALTTQSSWIICGFNNSWVLFYKTNTNGFKARCEYRWSNEFQSASKYCYCCEYFIKYTECIYFRSFHTHLGYKRSVCQIYKEEIQKKIHSIFWDVSGGRGLIHKLILNDSEVSCCLIQIKLSCLCFSSKYSTGSQKAQIPATRLDRNLRQIILSP